MGNNGAAEPSRKRMSTPENAVPQEQNVNEDFDMKEWFAQNEDEVDEFTDVDDHLAFRGWNNNRGHGGGNVGDGIGEAGPSGISNKTSLDYAGGFRGVFDLSGTLAPSTFHSTMYDTSAATPPVFSSSFNDAQLENNCSEEHQQTMKWAILIDRLIDMCEEQTESLRELKKALEVQKTNEPAIIQVLQDVISGQISTSRMIQSFMGVEAEAL